MSNTTEMTVDHWQQRAEKLERELKMQHEAWRDLNEEFGDVIDERDDLLKELEGWHSAYLELVFADFTQEADTGEYRRLVTKELLNKFSRLVGSD